MTGSDLEGLHTLKYVLGPGEMKNASTTMSKSAQVLDNALGAVGSTPLIRLDKVVEANGLKCNLCKLSLPI